MRRFIVFFFLMLSNISLSYSDESGTKLDELSFKDKSDLLQRALDRAMLEAKLSGVRKIYSPESFVMPISLSSHDSVQDEYIANFIKKFEECAYSLRPFDVLHQSGAVRFEVEIGLNGNLKKFKIIHGSKIPGVDGFVEYSIRTCAPYAEIPEKIRLKAHTVLISSKVEIVPGGFK